MHKNTIFLLLLLFSINLSTMSAKAQFIEDFRAKAVLEKQYTDIKGNPYLNGDWSMGIVKLAMALRTRMCRLNMIRYPEN